MVVFLQDGVALDSATHPYSVVRDSKGMAAFDIPGHGVISPVRVGSDIVRYMKQCIDSYLGHTNVKVANIAVPAKFNGLQRDMTKKAFTDAGFIVLRILDEPAAAAIAYGLDKNDEM